MLKLNNEVNNHINYVKEVCSKYQNKKVDNNLLFLKSKIESIKYKGVILYAHAVHFDPIQRPQQMLRVLGKMGYLCIFCDDTEEKELLIQEKYPNLFVVNHQEYIIPLLKNEKVIFLITFYIQYVYSMYFNNKTIWMDILDRLNYLADYNCCTKKIYNKCIKEAMLITYSAPDLFDYCKTATNPVLLENAACLEDFKIPKKIIPEDMANIIKQNKKIIGYYGLIDKIIDFNLIKILSTKYSIVVIGNINKKMAKHIPNNNNIYYLGFKKYSELKYYLDCFDVTMIPFKVNKITNSVSPIKFFEYLAFNKPVLSTNIKQIKKYNSSIIKIVNKKNILECTEKLLYLNKEQLKEESNKIVKNNTWESRLNTIEDLIGEL